MHKIGIDPDLVRSGVAFVHGQKILELSTLSMPELIEYVVLKAQAHEIEVLIEDVESIKPTFARKGTGLAAMRKISQNVGQVKAAARLIREMLVSKGVDVKMVGPLTGAVKMKAKKNSEYFNKLTGWGGRSNQDTRDAALIALHGWRI